MFYNANYCTNKGLQLTGFGYTHEFSLSEKLNALSCANDFEMAENTTKQKRDNSRCTYPVIQSYNYHYYYYYYYYYY